MTNEVGIDQENSQGRRRVLLYGFTTGSHALPTMHERWLSRFAREAHDPNIRWQVLGISSRLGDRTRPGQEFNEQLSLDRANVVASHLTDEAMAATPPRPRMGLVIPNLNVVVAGVGTRSSDASDINNNTENDRAVFLTNGSYVGSEFTVTARRQPQLQNEFHVKYLGGGGVSLFKMAGGVMHMFAIRDSQNFWQKYKFTGPSGGVGLLPFSYGDAVPRGQGWVSIRTRNRCTVEQFSGAATIPEAGIQVGDAGVSFLRLEIGARRSVQNLVLSATCPTGPGISAGFGLSAGSLTKEGRHRFGVGWQAL